MEKKTETFLISISIIEGRHYIWSNMDSAVVVKIDNKKRCTAVQRYSDAPLYNEYFVFEFSSTMERMLEKTITVTVIRPRTCCRKRKILGDFTLDIATLWSQENHNFYHKWAVLGKSDNFTGPTGYLKIDISLLFKGQVSDIPVDTINDEIEGNLLLPDSLYHERQKALYLFNIYKCENLVAKPSISINDNRSLRKVPSTYVEVTFTAQKVRTSVKKNTHSPVFNEELTIIDLFPPLCQRIKIEICYSDSCKNTVNAARYLDLKGISNDGEDGFLPTFGPTYLHMYFNNNLGGFAGKMLVSMRTELQEIAPTDAKVTGTLVKSIPSINEEDKFDDVVVFGMIFGATAISKGCCDKVVSYRMTFGSTLVQKNTSASGDNVLMNSTPTFKPKAIGKQHYYLPLESQKPSLVITKELPSCRKRMYNSNMLSKISKELKIKLTLIEHEFESNSFKLSQTDIREILADTLDFIRTSGEKYIDIVKQYNFDNGTELDKQRKKMCLREMQNILDKVDKISSGRPQIKTAGKIHKLCSRIDELILDVQDCWPDLHLWMIFGSRKSAYCRIPARDILFSPIEEEKGEHCGKMRTILFFPNPKDDINISCKMDIMLWLGIDRHKYDCFASIPDGYQFDKESVLKTRQIQAEQKYIFHLRAHIFQGKILPGFDRSGLADTYVRVIIRDKQAETKVIHAKLNPIWDQTLVLPELILYGSKSYLRHNIPNVLVELLDRDICTADDTVGRTLVTPLIKFREDPYTPPNFPPKLIWVKTYQSAKISGEVLSAFEYIEVPEPEDDFQMPSEQKIYQIPDDIKPQMVPHRVEVLFWGMRDLRKLYLKQINRPRVSVICEEGTLVSDTIDNAKKNSNFVNKYKIMDVVLPLEAVYAPPLCIKIHESRRFGVYLYAGVHISDTYSYLYTPITSQERERRLHASNSPKYVASKIRVVSSEDLKYEKECQFSNSEPEEPKVCSILWVKSYFKRLFWFQPNNSSKKYKEPYDYHNLIDWCKNVCKRNTHGQKSMSSFDTYETLVQDEPDPEDFDWWTKYYASIDKPKDKAPDDDDDNQGIKKHTLKVYPNELELQPEFNGFTDMFASFEMYKGKRTGDETVDEENITAVFKGSIKIYRWPPEVDGDYVSERGLPLQDGIFHDYPDNLPVRFILRVYCIQGIGLRPKDRSGTSDPYLYLKLNDKVINDREHYIPRQINPVFGRMFEFNGNFPNDHTLHISIWDYDWGNYDDLIGETEVDIENRFYTKHRAFCGIHDHYDESGYCAWRGRQKPSAILMELCKTWGLEGPAYEEDSVRIGPREFITEDFTPSGNADFDKDVLALTALRRWDEIPVVGFPIVPEHVECRSLYNPSKPGIEQGKLQLWIDIFPITDLPPPKSVVITPRKPVKYELRVIIWNTDEVVLTEDLFFTGDQKSDIYIKGWVTDSSEAQYTDVHYKSLTGEGNFNWRFVFPLEYLTTENKLVMRKKQSIFSSDETEFKIPCKLTLQVWDNDTFSSDDFLGTLSLDLSKMPRGARLPNKCTLAILEPYAPRINLFKVRRTKGWWPFRNFDESSGKYTLQGKVEAELEIVCCEEAEKTPVGLGRNDPQGLPPPKRPDVSFSWFRNPLKALHYVICKLHRKKITAALIFVLLVALGLVAVYSFPKYFVKKLLGA